MIISPNLVEAALELAIAIISLPRRRIFFSPDVGQSLGVALRKKTIAGFSRSSSNHKPSRILRSSWGEIPSAPPALNLATLIG